MKNNYIYSRHKLSLSFLFMGILFLSLSAASFAQVRKPFAQRTSVLAPDEYKNKTIYNLRGDFKMIGNTNLTGSSDNNSHAEMTLVDKDAVSSTSNSSMAELVLPANCTNIVYAGLYWSGRNSNLTNIIEENLTASHNGTLAGTDLKLTISSEQITVSGNTFNYPRYKITNPSNSFYLEIEFQSRKSILSYNNEKVRYRTSANGQWVEVNSTRSGSRIATIANDAISFTFQGYEYSITSLNKNSASDSNTNFTNSSNYISYKKTTPNIGTKNKIKFRKDNLTYTDLVADDYFIGNEDNDGIFTAYKDVTDYVRTHGAGNYWGANLDLTSGNGGTVGYFGGWGMVVIYENPTLNWRDITVFDGYAYVADGNAYELPLSGFKAAQNGPIKVTMGMMAGEGDYGISGDAFRIRNAADNNWVSLSHSNNQTNNFFNSSILTDGARNPYLSNNTGLDIVKFDLTNTNNSIIKNNQTSTKFQYANNGSGGKDTYVIYNIVFAVDAFVPEVESLTKVSSTNTSDINNLQENDEVTFTQEIYNYGSDVIENGKLDITIPPTMKLVSYSMVQNSTAVSGASQSFSFSQPQWVNPSTNAASSVQPATTEGGLLRWTLGNIPTQAVVSNLANRKPLATLTYKLRVTNNCTLLTSSKDECAVRPEINGTITGKGKNSGQDLSSQFIKGYSTDCNNTPIYGALNLKINPSQEFLTNCSISNTFDQGIRVFKKFCPVQGNSIARAEITSSYPAGTVFYSTLPTVATPTVVSGNFAVNTDGTLKQFYAVFPGANKACFYQLATKLEIVTEQPVSSNVDVCMGAEVHLPNSPQNGLTVYYFLPGSSTPIQPFVAPSQPGVYNYEIALGRSESNEMCFGPRKPFKITINAAPVIGEVVPVDICLFTSYTSNVATNGHPIVWEFWNGNQWVTYSSQLSNVSIVAQQLKVTNATLELNNLKFRIKATSTAGCTTYSSELIMKIKSCSMQVNPQIFIKYKHLNASN